MKGVGTDVPLLVGRALGLMYTVLPEGDQKRPTMTFQDAHQTLL